MALNSGVCRFVGGSSASRDPKTRRPSLASSACGRRSALYGASHVSSMPEGATCPTYYRAEKRARAGHAEPDYIGRMMQG